MKPTHKFRGKKTNVYIFFFLEEKNVDPFYADSMNLQKEILSPGGVEVYVSVTELLNNVAFIELANQVW